ncbi:hypothetical protein QJS10_CPB22g01352 [Acorus calamus]|uniref:Remorin C-terminal domain-containing protein n=1 Tax=Acorus calamus TaxID=4465 RepID=A0AAV9BZY1_ACOCL|nr:hypothetical protein QJS10_CPB22g01352 [Acorus calamus]
MSREFHALVLAGSNNNNGGGASGGGDGLGRIGEDEQEETNPLAISVVPEVGGSSDPVASPGRVVGVVGDPSEVAGVSIRRVKKEEVESKVMAWQTEEVTKINNRFKREDTVIKGWEGELVEKASSTFKKIERKLEEKRAKAMEKMQNDIARAHRKAEEKRASAEAKRGTKVARVLELANLMRAIGRAPSKRSVF